MVGGYTIAHMDIPTQVHEVRSISSSLLLVGVGEEAAKPTFPGPNDRL